MRRPRRRAHPIVTLPTTQSPTPARPPGSAREARRREWRALLALLLPILGGQVAQTANGFVDTLMAGQVSPLDLAAVAVGASIWVPLLLFMVGVIIAATPILAQHVGASRHARVVPAAWQALWLALAIGLFGFVLLRNAVRLFAWMDVPPFLQELTVDYLDSLSWGMPGIALFIGLRSYTESLSHPAPVLVISFIGLLANIPLNYLFIYGVDFGGAFWLPAMGGPGCGAATAVVMWLMAGLLWLYVRHGRHYREHAPAGTRFGNHPPRPDPRALLAMLQLGLPIGLAIFFEVSIFSAIAVLISTMGADVVAGHQIALNFASLTFMLPLSVGLALTVRTGLAVGAGDTDAARLAVRTGITLTLGIALFNAGLLLLGRDWIPAIYTDDPGVRALASALLVYAAIFQLPDALQVTANGALRGFHDTRVPMWLTLVAYWCVGLPLGWCLGFGSLFGIETGLALGPQGFWIGLVAGLIVAAWLLNRRLAHFLRTRSH